VVIVFTFGASVQWFEAYEAGQQHNQVVLSFFGTHYNKLQAIKRKYDPQSLFLIHEGIASDEWDADLVYPA
jgi:FAD/FMN-containing dehydrogenase